MCGPPGRWTLHRQRLPLVRAQPHEDVTVDDKEQEVWPKEGEPNRQELLVYRGVPTVVGVGHTAPSLFDGRAATLETQAKGAINGHMTMEPDVATPEQLTKIAEFQASIPLVDPEPQAVMANIDGPHPGKEVYEGKAMCSACHALDPRHRPVGSDPFLFADSGIRDLPDALEVRTYTFPHEVTVTGVDLGLAFITGRAADAFKFEIPSLRAVSRTAPYFHNNSKKALEDIVEHYDEHFNLRLQSDEKTPLVGFLKTF